MNEQMNNDIKWLTKTLNVNKKKQETIIVSKFDKEYYRNRYVAAMASLSEKTSTIVDLRTQLAEYKHAYKLTLTEMSQLDNTGNTNNE